MYSDNQLKTNIYPVASTGLDRVTDTRSTHTHPRNNKKTDNTHTHTQNFKAMNLRQQRTVFPERWETNEVSPTVASVYCNCFEKVAHRQEDPDGAWQPLNWEDRAKCLEKPRQLEITGFRTREERAAQGKNSRDKQTFSSTQLTADYHMHARKLRLGKNQR